MLGRWYVLSPFESSCTVNSFTEEFGGLEKDAYHPLGIARISFGAASTLDDVLQWVSFIRRYFVVSEAVVTLSKPLSTPETTIFAAATLQTLMLCA